MRTLKFEKRKYNMMKKVKMGKYNFLKGLVIKLLLLSGWSTDLMGQFHLGTYSFVAVGIGGPITDNIDLEGKLFANTRITDIGVEGAVMFDLRPGSFHQFSVGAGFNVGLFNGASEVSIVFPVELEIYPLPSFRRVSFLIELAPQFFVGLDEVVLRHMWGVRYYFRDPS